MCEHLWDHWAFPSAIREPPRTQALISGPCSCSSLRCRRSRLTGSTTSPSVQQRFIMRSSGGLGPELNGAAVGWGILVSRSGFWVRLRRDSAQTLEVDPPLSGTPFPVVAAVGWVGIRMRTPAQQGTCHPAEVCFPFSECRGETDEEERLAAQWCKTDCWGRVQARDWVPGEQARSGRGEVMTHLPLQRPARERASGEAGDPPVPRRQRAAVCARADRVPGAECG